MKPKISLDDIKITQFSQLTPHKIRQVLVVSSPYDFYLLEEGGRIEDLLAISSRDRGLDYVPLIRRVSSCAEAEAFLENEPCDLVITLYRACSNAMDFPLRLRARFPELPIVSLGVNDPDFFSFLDSGGSHFDYDFLWQGDGKILVGIIQLIEDSLNSKHDTQLLGVPHIMIVEDSPQFFSLYLTFIFDLLQELTSSLLPEDLSYLERLSRTRGRPKVHLARTYEEAKAIFDQFQNKMLGIFSDVSFKENGTLKDDSGLRFTEYVRAKDNHLPLVLQSSEASPKVNLTLMDGITRLLRKDSPNLSEDFRRVFQEEFGFGALILRDEEGKELVSIPTVESMALIVKNLPADAFYLSYKAGKLKRWLLARTEFDLANELEEDKIKEIDEPLEFRQAFSNLLDKVRKRKMLGTVVPFSRRFDLDLWHLAKMGLGSIGGKGRGLAFFDRVLAFNFNPELFPGVKIEIPRSLFLTSDIFDEFIETNRLLSLALQEESNLRITYAFLNSSLPPTLLGDLYSFLKEVTSPLAVRSSSLLEDALFHPFAGIYLTKMIPNNQPDMDSRFLALLNAIKLVYASTFFREAKAYVARTGNDIRQEKMAVIIQEVVGARRDRRFYPDLSGVARSYNFYPFGGAKPSDGVASVALGLGKTVVEGEACYTFIPKQPQTPPAFSNIRELISLTQREFYCINLAPIASQAYTEENQFLLKLNLQEAEKDGVLKYLASTYIKEEDRFYDGLISDGARVLTFAPILKSGIFPLSEILCYLLDLAEEAMGQAVEIEFACSLDPQRIYPAHFGFLQVRPILIKEEKVEVEVESYPKEDILAYSDKVLGNGVIRGLRDILIVQRDSFQIGESQAIAREIGQLNAELRSEGHKFILIGPGRWGSQDPLLGIPVKWPDIDSVQVVLETPLPHMDVEPSQGSHFFQNITSLNIGYFTIYKSNSFIDWDYLSSVSPLKSTKHLQLLRFEASLLVKIDGRRGRGIILKKENK